MWREQAEARLDVTCKIKAHAARDLLDYSSSHWKFRVRESVGAAKDAEWQNVFRKPTPISKRKQNKCEGSATIFKSSQVAENKTNMFWTSWSRPGVRGSWTLLSKASRRARSCGYERARVTDQDGRGFWSRDAVVKDFKSHGALNDGCNWVQSSCEFTVEWQVRRWRQGEDGESRAGRSTPTRMRRTMRRSRPRTFWRTTVSRWETPTQRKSSRTSSHEDKAVTQDIKWKYKVVHYVDKKTWSETLTALRCWSSRTWWVRPHWTWKMTNTPRISRSSRSRTQTSTWTRRGAADESHSLANGHTNTSSSRNFSRANWTNLTSRGGVLDGSVIQRRPHDNSISRPRHNHKVWRSGDSSPWMNHHPSGSRQGHPRHLGPLRREAVGGPTARPNGEAADNAAPQEHHKREVFRQTLSLFSVLCSLFSVVCSLFSVLCSLLSLLCSLSSLLSTLFFPLSSLSFSLSLSLSFSLSRMVECIPKHEVHVTNRRAPYFYTARDGGLATETDSVGSTDWPTVSQPSHKNPSQFLNSDHSDIKSRSAMLLQDTLPNRIAREDTLDSSWAHTTGPSRELINRSAFEVSESTWVTGFRSEHKETADTAVWAPWPTNVPWVRRFLRRDLFHWKEVRRHNWSLLWVWSPVLIYRPGRRLAPAIDRKLSLFAQRRHIHLSSTPHGLALWATSLCLWLLRWVCGAHTGRKRTREVFPSAIRWTVGCGPPPHLSFNLACAAWAWRHHSKSRAVSVLWAREFGADLAKWPAKRCFCIRHCFGRSSWKDSARTCPFLWRRHQCSTGVSSALRLQETIRHIRRADQEPSLPDWVFVSVQQPANHSAEVATETRNAFIRSRRGNDWLVRIGAHRRNTPLAFSRRCSALLPLCPPRSRTLPMNSSEGDHGRDTPLTNKEWPELFTELVQKVFLSRATSRPMFPNSTQHSQSIVRREPIQTSQRPEHRLRKQDSVPTEDPEDVSIDQPQPAAVWAHFSCNLPSAQSDVMTKTRRDYGATWGTPRCTRIWRWEETLWRRTDTSLWDHQATSTAIKLWWDFFLAQSTNRPHCVWFCQTLASSPSWPTWTWEAHSFASSATLVNTNAPSAGWRPRDETSLGRHPLQRRKRIHPEISLATCENDTSLTLGRMSDKDLVTAFFGINEFVITVQLASKERDRNISWIAAAILID